MRKLTIRDIDIKGKRILIRVDFNVPLDENQNITDDKRIVASIPTIKYAIEQGGKVILMSHLGRPKGEIVPEMSLRPVAKRLSELLNRDVSFAEDCIGPDVKRLVDELKEGDVLLLENLRFHKEEKENSDDFSKELARLGDIYVNDAFGSAHRAHSSTAGVAKFFDIAVSGFLMEKEIQYLGSVVKNPDHPFIAILGGAKISDKIPIIENFIERVDKVLIGGGMMFTFIKAEGKEIGNSLLDRENLDMVKVLMNNNPEKFELPVDCVITDRFDLKNRVLGELKVVSTDEILPGWIGLDIGPKTIKRFSEVCSNAKTVVWNGPMGVFEFEEISKGTFEIAKVLASITKKGAKTIIGGGDSASAVKKAGVASELSHVSTGGGASLEFLQGKVLPGIAALNDVEE